MKVSLALGLAFAAIAAVADEPPRAGGGTDASREAPTITDRIDLGETEEYVEMVDCISLRRVKRTEPVGNEAMLFYMHGGTIYLNQFKVACPRVGPPLVPNFVASFGSRFCRHDRIDLNDRVMGTVGWCTVGAFEEVSFEQAALLLSEPTQSGREVMETIEAQDE